MLLNCAGANLVVSQQLEQLRCCLATGGIHMVELCIRLQLFVSSAGSNTADLLTHRNVVYDAFHLQCWGYPGPTSFKFCSSHCRSIFKR